MTATDLLVRVADSADLPRMAELFWAARQAALPQMPPPVHTLEEIVEHYSGFDLASGDREAWVAEDDGHLVGYAELRGGWLDDLYVAPHAQGQGIGTVLLELVKAHRPAGFELWVFESNTPARAFYARHGLVEAERTDGSGNEEGAPDIRMEWRGERARPAETDHVVTAPGGHSGA